MTGVRYTPLPIGTGPLSTGEVPAKDRDWSVRGIGKTRVFVCGTKAVVADGHGHWRVVCATCDGGGSQRYTSRDDACKAVVRASASACRCKGCGAS